MMPKTTSSGGESVGSGALPDCLDSRFCARIAAMSIPRAAFLFTFMSCNLDSIHRADITSYRNKKLSYRRGTARRAMSVKTVLNVAQTFVELHLISPATGEWPSRSSKVIGNGTNRLAIWYFLLVVCSINVSILCHFFDTTTYVTACRGANLEKSFIFAEQLRLKTIDNFSFMCAHNAVNMRHIHWWVRVRKDYKQRKWLSRSFVLVPFDTTRVISY